jgi:hypothetical protein
MNLNREGACEAHCGNLKLGNTFNIGFKTEGKPKNIVLRWPALGSSEYILIYSQQFDKQKNT